MATSLLSFHLQIEKPNNVSQYQIFPAKIQVLASTLKQNHNRRPKIATTAITRKQRRSGRVKQSLEDCNTSSTGKLLSFLNSGCLNDALQVFDKMNKSNTFIWNLTIRGLTDSGYFQEALEVYCRMQIEGIREDKFTFPFVIKACTAVFGSDEAKKVHSRIIKLGFYEDIYVCNALIIMYAKVGSIENSEKIFDRMLVRDVVSWNSMISGYVSSRDGLSSLMCFQKMQVLGIRPDRFSLVRLIGGCALEQNLLSGKEVFAQVIRNGREFNLMIQSSLIDMFGKCGEVNYAERFFNRISQKNLVVWNAMIGAYSMNHESLKTFSSLKKMQEDDNLRPDIITLINLLPSCSKLGALGLGKEIHGRAIKNDKFPHLVLETSLIDMYGKCGSLILAEFVFFQMKQKNIISWNAMITAYVQNSYNKEAIDTFKNLKNGPSVPDETTFASILPAYAEIALPKEGKQIHGYISKLGISLNTFISNAMIHMYAKCGDLLSARKLFDSMLFKDVVAWNTIIMAYGIHGFGVSSLSLFTEMLNEGYEPNRSTFVSLLSSCSISGNWDEGWKYFNSMRRDYGLDPGIEHYGCMLDLLGRFGNFDCAKRFIEEMPLKPTSRIWGSLLAASRHYRNIEVAELAADRIFSLDNDNTGCCVLLSNMYADVGRWDDVARVRDLMKNRGLEKTTGCSIVECNGKTYKFTNKNRLKIESDIIFQVLDIISRKIGDDQDNYNVYTFKPSVLLKRRAKSPIFHSVRLAICFGLISTSVGDPVLVRMNTRICENCHKATKKISKMANREIIVGDSKIYHHFKNGCCSCGDYWR
ncbi:hypothetical protein RD792_002216 [Penstemon davidsonii]|uniref:DYW domain-containing protein n=1 Tax=Penstemon davidsonii TaxID=160366 RepID=A0ABR0DR49_9LAMI|nr:hypothetical protein RD792_002216 [Penstemon davidsonii]